MDLIDGPRRKAVEETANVLAPVIRFLEQQLTPGGIARTAELDRIRREGITPGGKRLPGDESTTPESERLSPDEARERAKRFGEIFGDLLDPSVFEATGRDAKRATQRFDESARAIGEAFEQITGAALALREVATRAAGVIDRNVEAV
mgnify:FL=1